MTESPDIQDLKNRIALLENQLMQAQKLSTLGELTSTTTHEFNNILMLIINHAKLGLRHKDEPSRTKALNQILTTANKASKITNTILAAARNRKKEFEPTNFAALVEDSLLLLERELNKYRITIEKSFADTLPEIMADGNQIQQVVLNLLINARQAMPNGGRLVLKMSYDEDNEMIDFIVRDFGCGIPQETLPRIFEPFYTTKQGPDDSGKGGTGLGLSNCKAIIEQHQGSIRVESTEGKGTAFTVKLPTIIRAKLVELQHREPLTKVQHVLESRKSRQ
jgi:signal transduction histidine kinase